MTKRRSSSTSQPAGQRQLRVGEEIRHALSAIFMRGESNDPLLDSASITVSEVRVSPDLKNATAYVMPLGGINKENVIEALSQQAPYLRHLVTDRVQLRFSPRIQFRLDDTYDEASKIDNLLRDPKVARDLDDHK